MKKLIFILPLIGILFFTSCEKKGYIDIENVDFWIKNNTVPFEVQFYLDFGYQPDEATVTWDFGDGSTSNEKEPVHIYNQTGKYTVKLTIVNYKTVEERSFIIDVSQSPMPIDVDFDFKSTYGKLYAPCQIEFYNYTQYASDFFWVFGDGTGSDNISPTHIYSKDSTYNVILIAYSGLDTASATLELPIKPPPSTISIDVVSVWLPEEFYGAVFDLHYYTDIFEETPNGLDAVQANDFPFGWIIGEDLYFFNGDYNDEPLYFEVWDIYDNQAPTYSFGIKFSEIQDNFYPDTLFWDDGDYAAEVVVSYKD